MGPYLKYFPASEAEEIGCKERPTKCVVSNSEKGAEIDLVNLDTLLSWVAFDKQYQIYFKITLLLEGCSFVKTAIGFGGTKAPSREPRSKLGKMGARELEMRIGETSLDERKSNCERSKVFISCNCATDWPNGPCFLSPWAWIQPGADTGLPGPYKTSGVCQSM
jgi:hypothetical protein